MSQDTSDKSKSSREHYYFYPKSSKKSYWRKKRRDASDRVDSPNHPSNQTFFRQTLFKIETFYNSLSDFLKLTLHSTPAFCINILLITFILSLCLNIYYYYSSFPILITNTANNYDRSYIYHDRVIPTDIQFNTSNGETCLYNNQPLNMRPVSINSINDKNKVCLCGPTDNYCMCSTIVDVNIAIITESQTLRPRDKDHEKIKDRNEENKENKENKENIDENNERSQNEKQKQQPSAYSLLLVKNEKNKGNMIAKDGKEEMNYLSLVSGIVQLGESFEQAAKRELEEQLEILDIKIRNIFDFKHNDDIHLFSVATNQIQLVTNGNGNVKDNENSSDKFINMANKNLRQVGCYSIDSKNNVVNVDTKEKSSIDRLSCLFIVFVQDLPHESKIVRKKEHNFELVRLDQMDTVLSLFGLKSHATFAVDATKAWIQL